MVINSFDKEDCVRFVIPSAVAIDMGSCFSIFSNSLFYAQNAVFLKIMPSITSYTFALLCIRML